MNWGSYGALEEIDSNNSRRVSGGSRGSMGFDVLGCMDGFKVSFRNMSKIYSCESNLPSGLGESEKPNS